MFGERPILRDKGLERQKAEGENEKERQQHNRLF